MSQNENGISSHFSSQKSSQIFYWIATQAGNITGRSPGARTNLNVSAPLLFVGGHENHNFSLLPHDLPVHRGFDGCIFDMSVRSAEAPQVIWRYYV